MGRLFAIVLFVLGVYAAATVATEGVDGAFGGLFARDESTAGDPGEHGSQPVTRRVADKVQGLADDRVERVGAD
ncbi:MAG: hypothetical protein FJ091_20690 [Deltaproteobacteria bacterium]|nr:hypothetical protein [Deltaproteobacteria bacterium]